MGHKREDVVRQLRERGRNDDADRAERELPERVDRKKDKGLLDQFGIDDSMLDKLPLDKLPGGLGEKLKDKL
jgi:hypothetical protein